ISSRSPFTAVSTLPSRSGNPGRPGTPGLGASPNQSSKKCPILRATRNNARSARHRVTSAAATAPAPTIHSPRVVVSGGCIGLSNIHFGDSPLCGMSLLYNQYRSEEHTSELQSRENLVCRLLLEIKNALFCLHL